MWILILSFLLFVAGFYADPFNVLIKGKRLDSQAESLVIGRLVKSRTDGMFSAGGLCGRCKGNPGGMDVIPYQYKAFADDSQCKNYTPYFSQSGLHAMIYSLIERAFPFSSKTDLVVLRLFKVMMLAAVMSLIVYWFFLEFGMVSAIFVMSGVLLTPWFTYLGKDLWFCVWTNFLPFLAALFLLRHNSRKKKPAGWLILLAVNLCILANFLINGYEWVSTTLVMASIPFFYYWIKDRWPFPRFLHRLIWLVAGSLASLAVTFSLLAYQISLIKGRFSDGIDWIIFSFHKRAHGAADGIPEVYVKQVSHPIHMVFLKYLKAPAFKFPGFITEHAPWYLDGILFFELILLFMLASWLVFYRPRLLRMSDSLRDSCKALTITTWISILAPFSWLVIFKGHAWSHDHIDFITWFMPFCLFGLALLGILVSGRLFKEPGTTGHLN